MDKPMFQRRHYEALAAVIRKVSRQFPNLPQAHLVGVVQAEIATMLKQDNPGFDVLRFGMACAASDEEVEHQAGRVGAGKGWR
jgi:hypothetical protein